MRKVVSLALLVCVMSSVGCVLSPNPGPTYATSAPPPPQYENPGQRHGQTYVRGRWNWVNGQWQWEAGYWQDTRQGSYWNDGYWEQRGSQWYWVDGQWSNNPPTTVYDHSTQPYPQPQPQPYPQPQPGPVVVRPNPQPQPYPQPQPQPYPQPQPQPQPPPMGRPVIYTVNPTMGPGGTQVRIQGDFFGPEDYVEYGNVRLRTLSQSRTHFDVRIPVGLPAGTSNPLVVVSPRGSQASQQSFSVTP